MVRKYNLLPVSVFITGACVLIVEVVATRILSPYYGNTIFTVSSVITVILAALSLGYYGGGKLADRHPTPSWFFGIILLSGVILLISHFFGIILLPAWGYILPITFGPLISSLLLFFFPALLLGVLSPYAIKLESLYSPDEGVGSVAGKIFFCSTLGSIFGGLSAGFVLIPHLGIDKIIISVGVLLFLLGLIPLWKIGSPKRDLSKLALVFVAILGLTFLAAQKVKSGALFSKDGVYEKITIYDSDFNGRPVRFFQQDRSSSGAMFLDSDNPKDLVYEYSKYYQLYKLFRPDIKNVLVMGGGAYSIPKALLAEFPEAVIEVAEIEPSLFALAKKYFKAEDNPRLHNYTEDGRRFLHEADRNYDLIFSDVYYSLFSVPVHFTTQEFFSLAKNKLSDGGIFIGNFIGDLSRQYPSLIAAEIKTFQTIFPNSYFFAVESLQKTDSQNIIFLGYNSSKKIDWGDVVQHSDPFIRSLGQKILAPEKFDLSLYPIPTDNFSPIEYLTAKVLQRSFIQPY